MQHSISVIIPVTHRHTGDIASLHGRYKDGLQDANVETFEFIYVVEPSHRHAVEGLKSQYGEQDDVHIIEVARDFGEATAINLGAQRAQYDTILTLPTLEQIDPAALPKVIDALKDDVDLVLVRRSPRIDKSSKQIPARLLLYLSERFSDAPLADAGSSVRFFKKKILEEINLYGEFHRFMSMLAYEQGFAIEVIDIAQSKFDNYPMSSPWVYVKRVLDFLTIIFLTRFNKRPLRFFGSVGSMAMLAGTFGLIWIAIERLFFDVAAADRPMMLLFTLAAVLGIQLIAIGLVGESLIFTHAKDIKEYKIKKIHNKS